ncbi:hypothetical protein SB00610_03605 [Klebsiella quasipneumoniae subsp. similipneumoniae]|nr:hypothetical protein SB00610_03605 [Klebsiella quasipneumoniae subsp. similipneumoniae]
MCHLKSFQCQKELRLECPAAVFLRSILGTVPNQHVVILTMGKIHDTKL